MINLPPEFHKRSLCFSNESSDWKLTVDQLSAALSGIQVKSGLLPSSVGRGGLGDQSPDLGPACHSTGRSAGHSQAPSSTTAELSSGAQVCLMGLPPEKMKIDIQPCRCAREQACIKIIVLRPGCSGGSHDARLSGLLFESTHYCCRK